MTIKLAAIPAALLAVLALTACEDDSSSSKPDNDETTQTTDEPTDEASDDATDEASDDATEESEDAESEDAEESDDASGAGAFTAPGTELSLGESATIPATYGTKGEATLKLTVVSIKKGSAKDIADVKNTKGYTPWYVTYEAEILSTGKDGFGSWNGGSDIDGYIGDQRAGALITFGDFKPCENESFEYDAKVGDKLTTCDVSLAPSGETVDTVQWSSSDSDYDQFDGEPLLWK